MVKLFKKSPGQAIVLFVFLVPIIIGFLGLAVDIGMVTYEKQKLQDSLDLCVIAAVQAAVNHGQVESTAVHYANMNGIKDAKLTVVYPYKNDPNKVQISATKEVKFAFLPVLGINSTTISAKSAASADVKNELVYREACLNYAVFSGSTTLKLEIKGNNSVINGNVHGNFDVNFSGAGHQIYGNLEAGHSIGGKVTVSGTSTKSAAIVPTPNLAFDEYKARATRVFNSDQIFNDVVIDGIWLINGNVKLNGGRISGRGIILATGSVDFPGNNVVYSSSNDLLAVYALGDITLSCTKNKIQGVLYAPNGTIKINGSDNTFYGALIANNVTWATADTTINGNYDIRVPQAFTISKTYLKIIE